MADSTDIDGISESEIAESAASPQSFSVEGLSQTNRSLADLIAADKYLRKRKMMSKMRCNPFAGIVSVGIPPGPCGR